MSSEQESSSKHDLPCSQCSNRKGDIFQVHRATSRSNVQVNGKAAINPEERYSLTSSEEASLQGHTSQSGNQFRDSGSLEAET